MRVKGTTGEWVAHTPIQHGDIIERDIQSGTVTVTRSGRPLYWGSGDDKIIMNFAHKIHFEAWLSVLCDALNMHHVELSCANSKDRYQFTAVKH